MTELWCVHCPGSDDLYAAPSKEAAEKAASAWQKNWEAQGVNDPKVAFVAAIWPHSAESHAKDLKFWDFSSSAGAES